MDDRRYDENLLAHFWTTLYIFILLLYYIIVILRRLVRCWFLIYEQTYPRPIVIESYKKYKIKWKRRQIYTIADYDELRLLSSINVFYETTVSDLQRTFSVFWVHQCSTVLSSVCCGQYSICRGRGLIRHWMRTTSTVVAENFRMGVGFSLTENVGQ